MTAFVLLAGLLAVLSLLLLLWPLLRPRVESGKAHERRDANLAVIRDNLIELEQERRNGEISAEEFARAQRELQRRALDENPEAAVPTSPREKHGWKTIIAIAILLPCLASVGYLWLGNPQALNPLLVAQPGKMTLEQIEGMVGSLAERLNKQPDDIEGWLMLGRSYKSLGRLPDAINAFAHAEAAMQNDPDFLTDYADLLAISAGGDLEGKPLSLIMQALKADPGHVVGLWLAGTAAYNRHDFPAAVTFWQRATQDMPADSEDRQMLQESIGEAKRRMQAKAEPGKSISGRVELAPGIQAAPSETVFIFARPVEGTRFPLAVAKVSVANLPFDFVLDDSLAMAADKPISSQRQVIVEARLSRSGNAIGKPGDMQSAAQTVSLGKRNLKVLIDRDYAPAASR
ncbi:MAG: c-type cytochrome biogenesis protein CcmI [Rhodocyclales bacterium GT-UBC]|nr:MAG: c-type cytochrome biogenesis protein CcmI [Rhodocyclales bacterium GT-UBC]